MMCGVAIARPDGDLPAAAGRIRRRAVAAQPVHHHGQVSDPETRSDDGGVGIVVMMGPIMGPTLGGYLTDFVQLALVFFVNVPFGVLAITGIVLFLRGEHELETQRFDWMRVFAFSPWRSRAAIHARSRHLAELVQFIRGRGLSNDRRGRRLSVHRAFPDAEESVHSARLFKDRDYVSSLSLTFVIGMLMLATTALLPPLPAIARRLHGARNRLDAGAARRRHDARHAVPRPHRHARRCPAADGDRLHDLAGHALADVRLDAAGELYRNSSSSLSCRASAWASCSCRANALWRSGPSAGTTAPTARP